MASRVGKETRSARGGKDKIPAKELQEIALRPAENGGVIAEHRFTSYEHKSEPHVFGADEAKALSDHILSHMQMDCPKE